MLAVSHHRQARRIDLGLKQLLRHGDGAVGGQVPVCRMPGTGVNDRVVVGVARYDDVSNSLDGICVVHFSGPPI